MYILVHFKEIFRFIIINMHVISGKYLHRK